MSNHPLTDWIVAIAAVVAIVAMVLFAGSATNVVPTKNVGGAATATDQSCKQSYLYVKGHWSVTTSCWRLSDGEYHWVITDRTILF